VWYSGLSKIRASTVKSSRPRRPNLSIL